jgi:DNA-binding response OmpR family regulator
VVIVSNSDSEVDKANAFDLDAAGYIVKPICVMSFLARIKALLAKNARGRLPAPLQYKGNFSGRQPASGFYPMGMFAILPTKNMKCSIFFNARWDGV